MENALLIVLLTALGVGGATVIGAIIGFVFKNISHRFSDIILGFAAGVMLSAAVVGLILPSLESGGSFSIVVTVVGIITGAICINLIDKLVPHLHNLAASKDESAENSEKLGKVLLFVLAIAMHNLPEGIAAGVGFGTGGDNFSGAITIALGIALQNIPEGMVIIAPMLAAGISRGKTLAIASLTGVIEIIGTLIGFFAVSLSAAILPFALAFAGGTMLFVIGNEMIPETHAHGCEKSATYSLLIGFCLMLVMDHLLG